MSFKIFFDFSSGLREPLYVPAGTYDAIMAHVAAVEAILGLEREKYLDNPAHWRRLDLGTVTPNPDELLRGDGLDITLEDASRRFIRGCDADDALCSTVEWHNDWVRRLYCEIERWSADPVLTGELLTPEKAQDFWHALRALDVPTHRWTASYYTARMEALYEVMRGRDAEGMSFDEEPLTERQAAAVVRLFDQYLDAHDRRLDVPVGHDYLASSADGGYDYCEECGPVHPDDWPRCPKRGECPIIADLGEEDRRDVLR